MLGVYMFNIAAARAQCPCLASFVDTLRPEESGMEAPFTTTAAG